MRDSPVNPEDRTVRRMAQLVAIVTDVEPEEMFAAGRGSRRVVAARDLLATLLRSECGMSLKAIARNTGRKASAVSLAVRRMEDAREDSDVDAAIGWLGKDLFNRIEALTQEAKARFASYEAGEGGEES